MSLLGLRLNLYLGAAIPEPAPLEVVQHLTSVQATRTNSAPGGFQLTFEVPRSAHSSDPPLLKNSLLEPPGRATLVLTLAGSPKVLMDGFITQVEVLQGQAPSTLSVTVTGEDVSVMMDRIDVSIEWPEMPDSAIVLAVLAKYAAIGVVPEVIPPVQDLLPLEDVPQQNGSDRSYLQELASKHAYLFYVVPGPLLGVNQAYWGPPIRIGTPQKALVVGSGPGSNVESASFSLNSLAPSRTFGLVQVEKVPVPVTALASTRLPPLAKWPALIDPRLMGRLQLFQHQGLDYPHALISAMAQTDASVDQVVTVQGEVDGLRYGHVLEAPGLVGVRGASDNYDGIYLVQQVSHQMTAERHGRWQYKQNFTLTREGVGSTVKEV